MKRISQLLCFLIFLISSCSSNNNLKELENLQKKINEQKVLLAKKNQELKNIGKKENSLEVTVATLESNLISYETRKRELKSKNEELTSEELDELQELDVKIEGTRSKILKIEKEILSLNDDLETMKRERDLARLEVDESKKQLEAQINELSAIEKMTYDLNRMEPLRGKSDDGERPAFFSNNCDQQMGIQEGIYYFNMINYLGGEIVDPHVSYSGQPYPETVSGLDKFLKDVGVKNFSGSEFSEIGNKERLQKNNLTNLMPPRNCWLRTAALGLIIDKIRRKVAQPIRVNSYWRPENYNHDLRTDLCVANIIKAKKKEGAPYSQSEIFNKCNDKNYTSDHVSAKAVDIQLYSGTQYEKEEFRLVVEEVLCSTYWFDENLRISAGFADDWAHIGIDSSKHRSNRYFPSPSYEHSSIKDDFKC